ncbi:Uncharacterised protein [Burkholderia pseudomallei]|nr:Uncharacterised protein [Burkholderia pseudomallei]CAJ7049820.1 Uncharacterised protein [Burkholderia pseudomallei]CAJ7115454.1 Uncharacterised protein [Burkholderia pseudomallei]VBH83387.1 Uncharacterised protein [Burkholderia pseudomallei]VBS47052.1 Uncharacterised protein [Burkholderia pseudomallei]
MRAAFFAFVGCRRVSAHRGAARLRDACVGEWGEESRFYRGAHRGIPAPSECDPDGGARFCRFARRRALRGRRFSGRRTLPDARRRKRRGEQWTKGPRIQGSKDPRIQGSKDPRGRVHVSRRQSRKPCLPSSRGGSVTTAFRHGSWLDASTINVRRLPRNHGRRRVLHLSASIRCFTFAAAPRPNPKRPVRRPAARAIRRVRRSPFAARATKHHARRRCGPRRAHAADRPPRSFRSAHRLARDSCPLARARPRSRTGG